MRLSYLFSATALIVMAAATTPATADEGKLGDEARCLALSIYWESRDQDREGMEAVAAVIRNRVASPDFPSSVCEVVHQGGETPPCQFYWWCDGRSDEPTDMTLWDLAREVALAAPPEADPTGGALFFKGVNDADWAVDRKMTIQIGDHIFYN